MAQIVGGLRSILASPLVYGLFQNLMGAKRFRKCLVENHIRPAQGISILDVGCGPADILSYFPKVEYWGYDISAPYIEQAKKRFDGKGRFVCKLLTQDDLDVMPKFDVAILIGVLHHLGDEEANTLMSLIYSALKPGGRLITADACYIPRQNLFAHYLISKDRGRNVREALAYERLAKAVFTQVKHTIRHQAWIPYTHLIMECHK